MGSHVSPTADEVGDILAAIRKLVRFLRLADREAESTTGLSAAQLYVLHCLAEQPAGSLAELAQRTLTDPSSVSTVVERLVRRGMVKRARSRDDLRRQEIRLTPIGQRIVRSSPRVPQRIMIENLTAMPADKRGEIARALARLLVAIGAENVPPRMLFEDEPASSRRGRARTA